MQLPLLQHVIMQKQEKVGPSIASGNQANNKKICADLAKTSKNKKKK